MTISIKPMGMLARCHPKKAEIIGFLLKACFVDKKGWRSFHQFERKKSASCFHLSRWHGFGCGLKFFQTFMDLWDDINLEVCFNTSYHFYDSLKFFFLQQYAS